MKEVKMFIHLYGEAAFSYNFVFKDGTACIG